MCGLPLISSFINLVQITELEIYISNTEIFQEFEVHTFHAKHTHLFSYKPTFSSRKLFL
jgi:hypothetical protein